MAKNNNMKFWIIVIVIALIAGFVGAFLGNSITGNVIKQTNNPAGKYQVYTKAEIDYMFNNCCSITGKNSQCEDTYQGITIDVFGMTKYKEKNWDSEVTQQDKCALALSYKNNQIYNWRDIDSCSGKNCYIQEANCNRFTNPDNSIDYSPTYQLIKCPGNCTWGVCK